MIRYRMLMVSCLLILFLAGCSAQSARKLSPQAREGKKVYDERGCDSCHKIDGKGGNKGPDLSEVGRKHQDRNWYRRYFREPRSVMKDAKMPPVLLTDEQIERVIDYMLSLGTTD